MRMSLRSCSIKKEALIRKQAPLWDRIINQLRSQLEEPHDQVQISHGNITKALVEDPLIRKYMNPLAKVLSKALHKDQMQLHRKYICKMAIQFHEAEDEYKALCAYPSGLLARIKLFRVNAVKECAHMAEYVHRKKGTMHTMESSGPAPVGA